ncbi:fibronectin type III-like domain-contianing protein [Nonomuraea sp. H19]|uniref:fibronectin type III-like domain-contianing protein n=1 Tax=Nonomuraea sp. H19 TaxID=3452206 RepID=UPI003F8B247E
MSVDVTNPSRRDVEEVAQLSVHQRHGTSSRPVRELKGFERVLLPAGETRTVTFELGPDALGKFSELRS